MTMDTQIMVGMSGGVDSSVSALLLKREGLDIAGMFMKNWEEDDRHGTCPAEQDAADAAQIAEQLGIKLHTRNFAAEYWDHVFEDFLAEYRAGRTPNPDILCNREIKFKTFLEHAQDLGAEQIATGHYARRDTIDGRHRLLRGRDHNKDQSYFLYTLGQQQLARTLFPVGEIDKPEVRRLAEECGLDAVAKKKDSTGICFIGERNFKSFLAQYLPAQPGDIRDADTQQLLGTHDGLMYFTRGQRQGIGIGGLPGGSGKPWFTVHKDLSTNTLWVAQGGDHPMLLSSQLVAKQSSWVAGQAPAQRFDCVAKTRYRQADQACQVTIDSDELQVSFDQAQRAVTPGQSIVFYSGDECLGGAIIESINAPVDSLHALARPA